MRQYPLRIKLLILLFSQLIFAISPPPFSYSYIPKFVYKNQVFPVTILVRHYDLKYKPHFEFDSLSLMQPINGKPVKTINKDEAFFTFYFKAKTDLKEIEIPTLAIWDLNLTYILEPKIIKVKELKPIKKNFSQVLASNLRVDNVKINPYDSRSNLITLSLEGIEANIEDMHIPTVTDDGVENIVRDGANVRANYYFIVDSDLKDVTFSYYNTIKKRFIDNNIDLSSFKNQPENSTLNPKDLSFDKFKKYSIILLTLFIFLLFVFFKEKFFLFVALIPLTLLIYIYIPKGEVCIKEGASLYILPTKNSNISLQIESQIRREVLNEYNNYYKIEYKNNTKGWIKDEDLCED